MPVSATTPAIGGTTFPKMQVDEALLLKCYDSVQDGRARFTAHTAFVWNPTTPADNAGRGTIEVRALVFY